VTAAWLPDRFRRSVPWRVGDVFALVGTSAIGLALVFVAWFCGADALHVESQVRWLNVGIAGVIAIGVGNLLWLITCRRAIGELRRLVVPLASSVVPAAPLAGAADDVDARLVSSANMTRFHLTSCPFVAGKRVRAATEAAHARAGRRPCDLCAPLGRSEAVG
jgi:hypothetical protein